MPAMTKPLLTKGFEFATDCYTAGIDATPFTTWLSDQARTNLATPANAAIRSTPQQSGNFDDAVLAAVQSVAAGIAMPELVPMLAQYGKPNNQIGTALARLQKKGLVTKTGDIWSARIVRSLDTHRQRRGRPAGSGRQKSGAEMQAQAATA